MPALELILNGAVMGFLWLPGYLIVDNQESNIAFAFVPGTLRSNAEQMAALG